jgi:hypothetical protein
MQCDFGEWKMINRARKVLVIIFIALGFGTLNFAQTHSSVPKTELSTRVPTFHLSATSLADAVAKASVRFHVPIGLEWMKDAETLRPINRTWNDKSVLEIMSSIVASYPGYALKENNGIVNVFRQDLLKDSRNFLNLKLPDAVKIQEQVEGVANQQLRSVVQNVVSPKNLPPGGEASSYATGIEERQITLDLGGKTVRASLNALVLASEHKMWLVTFPDSNLTPRGFFRTATTWHPEPFQTTDQPMWDFLTWSQYQTILNQMGNREAEGSATHTPGG